MSCANFWKHDKLNPNFEPLICSLVENFLTDIKKVKKNIVGQIILLISFSWQTSS